MKTETESAIRSIVSLDSEITREMMERAIDILRGRAESVDDLVHVIRRQEAIRILNVHRRTLDYYVKQGYLDTVYGGGRRRALGISRESLVRFMRLRVGHPAPVQDSTTCDRIP